MITGELKNKIDKIWEVFWTGGITNPLAVIEQLTYLLFIKGLDEAQKRAEQEVEMLGGELENPVYSVEQRHLRWSSFKELEAEQLYQLFARQDEDDPGVFQFIKNIGAGKASSFAKYMKDAIFMVPTPKMLERVVSLLDAIPMEDRDTKGDVYEYLLAKIASAGQNGQFRTPRHIIDMMVKLIKPTPKDTIIDPACGSGGFLVAANNYLRDNHKEIFTDPELNKHFNNEMFFGHDMDSTMLRIGAMNMMLHGVENPNIDYRDSLDEGNVDENRYTIVLANPPFKGSLDYESCAKSLLKVCKTKKTELLFLALMIRSLKLGGRCAVIVPDGVLFGSSSAHKDIRKEIVDNQKLTGVISMPSGVFKPYAGVSTAILLFTKTNEGGTDKVWFYDMKNDGFSLDDKRDAIEGSDIPDIISRFPGSTSGSAGKVNGEAREDALGCGSPASSSESSRKRTDQSFLVPVDEIRENAYDLSINRYKEIEYEEVNYGDPRDILAEIKNLQNAVLSDVEELEGMLK